jgi:hypothetical protein
MGVQRDSILAIHRPQEIYDSVRRKVLCIILLECGVPMTPVRLIKMCLNLTNNEVHIAKHLSHNTYLNKYKF